MAKMGSLYLPDVSRLFAGEEHILSWHEVPLHEWDPNDLPKPEIAYWKDILGEERVRKQIDQPAPAWEKPATASQKQVEQATAAINVLPNADGHYDITQIKSDASWISAQLNIAQVQSLRVVLLEWQFRPRLHLQAGYSEAEVASLKDVYGSHTAFDADFEASLFRLRDEDDFNSESGRRRRQIFIHFQESFGFIRTWLALQDDRLAKALGLATPSGTQPAFPAIRSSLQPCLDSLTTVIQDLAGGPQWDVIDEESTYIWQAGHVYHAKYLMQCLVVAIRAIHAVPARSIDAWFKLMGDVLYLSDVLPSPLLPVHEVQELFNLVVLTTLTFVDPASSIDLLERDPNNHWVSDLDVLKEIHMNLLNATDAECRQAVPAAFAWALILQKVRALAMEEKDSPTATRAIETYDSATGRRSSMGPAIHTSVYEDIIDTIASISPLADPISVLIRHTTEVLDVSGLLAMVVRSPGTDLLPAVRLARTQIVQELVIASTNCLPDGERYGPIVLTPQFALLDPTSSTETAQKEALASCTYFLGVAHLVPAILDQAAARFPHEALPFLQLCRLLAQAEFVQNGTHYITDRLQRLTSFTRDTDGQFSNYRTVDEEENANRVMLENNAYAFTPDGQLLLSQGASQQTAMVIPADTTGEVISWSEPYIVRWNYEYSGFHLVGEWLERYHNGTLTEVLSQYESASDVATELILLLANLLRSTSVFVRDRSTRAASIDSILHEPSVNLQFGSDIISLVFDVLEQELQAYRRKPSNTFDTSVLSASLAFIRVVLKVKPARFWQHIIKTSVVDVHGGSSLLYTVIAGVESVSGSAPVTVEAMQLYRDLIGATLRKSSDPLNASQWRTRSSPSSLNNNTKIHGTVMSGMTQNMLDVFESMNQWRPLALGQESHVLSHLSTSFSRLIHFRYGMGAHNSSVSESLQLAGELIVSRLRPQNIQDAATSSIMSHLLDAIDLTPSFSRPRDREILHQALFKLSNVLANVASHHKLPPTGFESAIFDLVPILVRSLDSHQQNASRLLRTLLRVVNTQKPTSLLGHLGSSSCINFLSSLCFNLTQGHEAIILESWRLLDSIITKDQQWLSVVLLTGQVPDKTGSLSSGGGRNVYRGNLVVDQALERLLNIDQRVGTESQQKITKAVLTFTITAQQNWSWTTSKLKSQQALFDSLVKFTSKTSSDDVSNSGSQRRLLIALITDLSSINLQYAKSVRDLGLMKTFRPLIEWLTTHAIAVGDYNTSLHANLMKNFSEKFGLCLNDFKNNYVDRVDDIEYYNLLALDYVLEDNQSWNSTLVSAKHTQQSYRAEIERANDNLRLVESEIILLHSFRNLCVEQAAFFVEDKGIQIKMADIIQWCLKANAAKHPPARLFDNLLQSRADMALAMIDQLVKKLVTGDKERTPHGSDFLALLGPAWESAIANNATYDSAINNNDLQYWRTSMTIVRLALQFHLGTGWKPLASQTPNAENLLKRTASSNAHVLAIATALVGEGLQTIVTTLQEQKQADLQQQPKSEKIDVGLRDVALILNTLETILRMRRLPEFASQLSERLCATDTIESATRLYMFAHLLADDSTNNDPIHAEYAVRLLVALSSLPGVAEEMAVQGVLSTILTARVTQVLQRIPEGVAHLDSRAHCSSLYTIWAEGLLPLALNLLHAVQGPVASEITLFLNAFPEQLKRAGMAIQPRDGAFITLQMTKELSALSLLSYILQDFRQAGASAAVDPSMIQELGGFDEHRRTIASDFKAHIDLDGAELRRKIVPINEKEAKLLQYGGLSNLVKGEMELAYKCLEGANEEVNSTSQGQK